MDLSQIYAKMLENRALAQDIEKAKAAFQFQPFAIQFRPVFLAAKYGRWLLGAFSVATGLTALADPFSNALPIWVSFALAALLLVALESGKSFFSSASFQTLYQSGRIPILALPALACFALSVWLSLTGVQTLYTHLDRSKTDLTGTHSATLDSLNQHYQTAIESEKTALAEFKKSITWKGKIDTYNPTNRAVIQAHTARVEQLNADHRTEKELLLSAQVTALQNLDSKTSFNIGFWVIVSAINEILILSAVWFMVYYQHRIKLDAELFSPTAEAFKLTWAEFQNILSATGAQLQTTPSASLIYSAPAHAAQPSAAPTNRPQIGFQITPKPIQNHPPTPLNTPIMQGNDPKEAQRLRDFLAKYPRVVEMLEKGEGISTTAKACNVSKATVQNVRRCLNVLKV